MNLALNPFDKGKNPEKIEDVVLSNDVNRFLEAYKHWRNLINSFDCKVKTYAIEKLFDNSGLGTYSAGEIAVIVDLISPYDDLWVSKIINYMIHVSPDKEFKFNVNLPLYEFCTGLRRKKVTVVGDVGAKFADNSLGCEYIVKGKAGLNFGLRCKKCKFYIDGDFKGLVAQQAKLCTFEITGNLDGYFELHDASDITLILHDDDCYKKLKKFHDTGRNIKVIKK